MLSNMTEPLTVSIAELRTAANRALDAVASRLGSDVSLDVDHYWHLPVVEAFDLTTEPTGFTVGQVSDDVESIRDAGTVPAEAVQHDIGHLIGVLRALEFATGARRRPSA